MSNALLQPQQEDQYTYYWKIYIGAKKPEDEMKALRDASNHAQGWNRLFEICACAGRGNELSHAMAEKLARLAKGYDQWNQVLYYAKPGGSAHNVAKSRIEAARKAIMAGDFGAARFAVT